MLIIVYDLLDTDKHDNCLDFKILHRHYAVESGMNFRLFHPIYFIDFTTVF
jgi:hypothetical protein